MVLPATPSKLRALVVDDESSVRLALKYAMEDDGWEVVVADSGARALELLAPTDPEVIVADKNMPGMSGIELLRRVRKGADYPDVAFVLITGFGTVQSARDAMEFDVDGYVEKPFLDVFETSATIRAYAARRRERVELRDARAHFTRAANSALVRPPARVGFCLDDPALLSRLSRILGVDRVSEDGADMWVTDVVNLAKVVGSNPGAIVAVVTGEPVLAELLALIDAGANAVLDPKLSDEELTDRFGPLLRRSTWVQ